MSILSGFKRFKRYTKTSDGYIPSYEKTIANAVCFGDGTDDSNTVETNLSAIKGITTSTAVTETGYAADAKVVSELNSNIENSLQYNQDDDYIYINGEKWKKANLSNFSLFDNGVLGEYSFTFKHMERFNSSYDADSQSSDFQYFTNRIYAKVVNTSWNWASKTLTTINPIDITSYKKMHILFDATSPYDGYTALIFGLTKDGTTPSYIVADLISSAYQGATAQECVLDISSVSGGLYYPFAELQLTSTGTRTLSVYRWWFE